MTKPIRIAHIVGNLETGGTQTLLIEIMRRLDRGRFDPYLIHLKNPNHFEKQISERGWECVKIRASRSYRVQELRRLAAELASRQTQLVHTHSDFANFAGRAAAIYGQIPHTVVHYQNTYEHRMGETFRQMEALLAPRTDAFIACSRGVRDYLAENLDLAGRPVELMQNAVDLEPCFKASERSSELREKLGVGKDTFHIVHTARLEPHKQPEQLLKALSLSTRDSETMLGDWRATFLGGGSLEAELKKELARLDEESVVAGGERIAGRVQFPGWTREIAEWLATADVFCLVSRNEGLPLSLVEALAAGAPAVASNIIGPQEVLLDNEYGILVDSSDPEQILGGILRYQRDPDFHREMRDAGQKRAKEFGVDRYVKKLESFYEALISKPSVAGKQSLNLLQRLKVLYELRHAARLGRKAEKRAKAI